jgi:hypothetical protein
MLIWLALLIPISAVIILAVFFTRKMVWWEYLLVIGIPILIIFAGKIISVTSQTMATEYWNSYVVRAVYEEEWDEWITETCYRTVSCGKNCTEQVPYDCSHRVYHPPEWIIFDNIGERISVSQSFYGQIKKMWGNETFKDMNRNYYHIDGNAYFTVYKDSMGLNGIVPVCKSHLEACEQWMRLNDHPFHLIAAILIHNDHDPLKNMNICRCTKCGRIGSGASFTFPTGGDDFESHCPTCFAPEEQIEDVLE